jgi:HNH endonuclease
MRAIKSKEKAKRGEKEEQAKKMGFWADEYGNVFNRNHSLVKQYTTRTGYKIFHADKNVSVHRFVWFCEVGPIPEGMVISHVDKDRANNVLKNLMCVSHSEGVRNRMEK